MDKVVLFIALSLPVIYLSKRTLFDIKSHGFPRFFSWECIIALFVANYKFWFVEPLSVKQVISWLLLVISAYMVDRRCPASQKSPQTRNSKGR